MSATELKLQIINKVATIQDELILEEIYKFINIESGMDSIYRLTAEEHKAIDKGLNDIKENMVYSSEAADNMVKKWLKK